MYQDMLQTSGSIIKYGAYFPTGIPTASISESGIFDDAAGGDMLLRSVYPANKVLVHTQASTFFTLICHLPKFGISLYIIYRFYYYFTHNLKSEFISCSINVTPCSHLILNVM